MTVKKNRRGIVPGRRLQSGRVVKEEPVEISMTISSKCPTKWLFIDLESGAVWHTKRTSERGELPHWRRASGKELAELKKLKINR